MSGLNINIPPVLLAGLYKDTLIASEGDISTVEKRVSAASAPAPGPVTGSAPAELPRSAAVAPMPEEQNKPVMAMPTAPSFLGNNAKGILIMVKDMNNVHLSEEALALLSGILGACRLNMADVAVMNFARNPFSFAALRQQMQVNYCFLFEVTMQDMQLAFAVPPYQVFAHDNCTFLSAPSLSAMLDGSENARLLKGNLWLCLKKIFNI